MRHTLIGVCVLVASGTLLAGEPPMFDLTQVKDIDDYTGPADGKQVLARCGMVITNETEEQLHDLYLNGDLPVFITTDTAVLAFQRVFEMGFKKFELRQADKFDKMIQRLWKGLVAGKFEDAGRLEWDKDYIPPALPEGPARLRAATVAAVAMKLLHPDWKPAAGDETKLYKQIASAVDEELKRVYAELPVDGSPLFRRYVDYSHCKPRSFYVGDKKLERFYRSRTFLGFPFNLEDDQALQTVLVLGFYPNVREDFIAPYREILGVDNVPTTLEISELARQDIPELLQGEKLGELREELLRRGIGEPVLPSLQGGGKLQASFIPKVAMHDSIMISRCIFPYESRLVCEALDALACLGNKRAQKHVAPGLSEAPKAALLERYGKLVPTLPDWPARPENGFCDDFPDDASDPDNNSPNGNLKRMLYKYESWIGALPMMWFRILHALSNPEVTPVHPGFMHTPEYEDKSLNTAMSGWAGYRHTVQLHAEEVDCLFGGGPEPSPTGYVEPNLPFWNTMIRVTLDAQELLCKYDASLKEMTSLTTMCIMARDIAQAQLQAKPLSLAQRFWLMKFGTFYKELNADQEFDPAMIATFANDGVGNALHVGLSRPQAIYVIIDYKKPIVLAKGGVLSYRDFWRSVHDGRLNDQEWQAMISEGKDPGPPHWMKSICAGKPLSDKQRKGLQAQADETSE